MPRVSEQYRTRRRDEILSAAWKCFACNGFHGTSMAEIISEAGLSAGAVYLYFRSKEDLIQATAGVVLGMARDLIGQLGALPDPVPPEDVVERLLDRLHGLNADNGGLVFPVAVEAWSEASRNPRIAGTASEFFDTIVADLSAVYDRWERAGHPLAVAAQVLARITIVVLQGHIVQVSGFGRPDDPDDRSGLRRLFTAASVSPARPDAGAR